MGYWKPFGGAELTDTQLRLTRVLKFLVRLIILSVPLYAILAFSIDLSFMQGAVAGNTFWMLSYAGYDVAQDGISLTIGAAEGQPFTFLIAEDCTGWKSMLFFSALIFAVAGVPMKRRLVGILIGLPLLWLGNLIRIFVIVSIQQSYGAQAAMFFHGIFWQAGLLALVLFMWIFWLFKAGRIPPNNINTPMQDKT